MTELKLILILIFLLMSNTMNFSFGQGNQTSADPFEYIASNFEYIASNFEGIGIPLVTLVATLVVGAFSARHIVGEWQKAKEISELRREILRDYTISFKNYVVLMDTFVLKLVMEFVKTDSPRNSMNSNRSYTPRLSELLPWEYTYNDLKHYSTKVPESNNLIISGEEQPGIEQPRYNKETICKYFRNLHDENSNCYVDFDSELLENFKKNNESAFQVSFYNIKDFPELSASLRQYYEASSILYEEFSAMWEYMLACYVLVNKILNSKTKEEFIDLLHKYNKYGQFLFDMTLNFEQKLISENLTLGKNK